MKFDMFTISVDLVMNQKYWTVKQVELPMMQEDKPEDHIHVDKDVCPHYGCGAGQPHGGTLGLSPMTLEHIV